VFFGLFLSFYGVFRQILKMALFAWNRGFWQNTAFSGDKKFPAFSNFCAGFSYGFPAISSLVEGRSGPHRVVNHWPLHNDRHVPLRAPFGPGRDLRTLQSTCQKPINYW